MLNTTTNGTDIIKDVLRLHGKDDGVNDDDHSKTITICAGVGILLIVMATCLLLCYRELNRRRLESELMDEMTRKDLIKKSVQHKLEQMKRSEDSKSYLEHMELKVPYVTFGEVTKISPSPSFVELHHRNSSHHNLHDHPYHHLHEQNDGLPTVPGSNHHHHNHLGNNSSALLHHGDHHHVATRSRSSIFTLIREKLFSRSRIRSDSSGSGSEEDYDGPAVGDDKP